jgi:hypothetical protein
MELTIMERLLTLGILSDLRGDITLLRVCQELIGKIGLSAKERKKYAVTESPDGNTRWRNDLPQMTVVALEPADVDVIADGLRKMSDAKTLTQNHLTLYEKFVK